MIKLKKKYEVEEINCDNRVDEKFPEKKNRIIK